MSSFKKKSSDEIFLKNRLKINKKTQKKNFQEYFFKMLPLNTSKNILDLGCGHGQFSELILKSKKYKKLYSSDINGKFIKKLRDLKKRFPNFYPHQKNMDKFNYNKNSLDLIFASYSIYYSKNINSLLSKMIKSLNKNGKIIIANPYKPHFLVNFVKSVHNVNKKVTRSLQISDEIYSFSKKKNLKVEKKIFDNETKLTKKDILDSYINSTMFEKNKLNKIKVKLDKIKNDPVKFIKKTSIIIITKS